MFISDYCKGDQTHTKKFTEYVAQRGYHLLTVKQYGAVLESAGFQDVDAKDNTDYFVKQRVKGANACFITKITLEKINARQRIHL